MVIRQVADAFCVPTTASHLQMTFNKWQKVLDAYRICLVKDLDWNSDQILILDYSVRNWLVLVLVFVLVSVLILVLI